MLAGATLVSLAVTFPVALSSTTQASAGALIVAHERSNILDALHSPTSLLAVRAADGSGEDARLAVDGREDTAWAGRPGDTQWAWSATFGQPVHLGLIRARFGSSPTSGVPTGFRWDVRAPSRDGRCDPTTGDDGWEGSRWCRAGSAPTSISRLRGTRSRAAHAPILVRRCFDACGIRLLIDRTNAGPPIVREVQALESARDVLREATASDDGAYPGFLASDAIDGRYEGRWAGAPGKSRWTLRVDLREPQPINRVRLVLGFDATSVPRPDHGRSYAIAWGPQHYILEASEDGRHFFALAGDPIRPDGSVLPLRRRLVTLTEPRTVKALRLVIIGATGSTGVSMPGAVPVVREIAAYRTDDPRPILASPWLLSVNANPSAESHLTPGGEVTNDAYWAKFLQRRFGRIFPLLRRDDRFDRALGAHGEPLDAPPNEAAGSLLESIEGDDPQLDALLLAQSSPPPIALLSGSNDWDYAGETGPDPEHPKRWHWDPLREARAGGIGQLSPRRCAGGKGSPFPRVLRRRADPRSPRGQAPGRAALRGRPANDRPRASPDEWAPDPGVRSTHRRRARVAR